MFVYIEAQRLPLSGFIGRTLGGYALTIKCDSGVLWAFMDGYPIGRVAYHDNIAEALTQLGITLLVKD